MGSLQVHLVDYMLADFGQENHLGHHLHNYLVELGSQVEALDRGPGALDRDPGVLDRDPGALGSQPGEWGKQHVLVVLGKLPVDTEGRTQLANTVPGGETRFACRTSP